MSTPTNLFINQANTIIDTPQVFYTNSGGTSVRIDAFTASNTSNVNASYRAYILSPGQTAENAQIPFKIVVWGEKDLGTGIVNQLIPPSGSLWLETSALDRIYYTCSGAVI